MLNFVNFLDIIYPVGSVYISFHSTSPASSIGGTWSQITDKVLRASINTNTGGEDQHTLSIDEMRLIGMEMQHGYIMLIL